MLHPFSIFFAAVILIPGLPLAAQAGASQGGPYSASFQSLVASGGHISDDALYRGDTVAGAISGSSTATHYANTSGVLPMQPRPVGIAATPASATVNETGQLEIRPFVAYDDGTSGPVASKDVHWSNVSGPVISILNGLTTVGIVYADTEARIAVVFQGQRGDAWFTVLNTNQDDFGSYAGDGLDDAWQTQYFGLNNPNATPSNDASSTGQTNLFKYVAGLNPTDRTSVFRVNVQPVSGQPSQKRVIFSPIVPDRTYTVVFKSNLTDSTWTPLSGALQSDNGQQRTVTDTNATGKTKFYSVQITKP